MECACVGVSSRRFPVRAVVVRPLVLCAASCACAAAGCGCASAAVPAPLLLLGCCCRRASSDDVLVIEEDDGTCTEGAAMEEPDAIAGLSVEDIARLLPKLKEVSVSLIDPKQNYTADNLIIPKSGTYGDLLGGLGCRCNRGGRMEGCCWEGALPAAHAFLLPSIAADERASPQQYPRTE